SRPAHQIDLGVDVPAKGTSVREVATAVEVEDVAEGRTEPELVGWHIAGTRKGLARAKRGLRRVAREPALDGQLALVGDGEMHCVGFHKAVAVVVPDVALGDMA